MSRSFSVAAIERASATWKGLLASGLEMPTRNGLVCAATGAARTSREPDSAARTVFNMGVPFVQENQG
ncbi:hypothetical protein D9M72_612180 [compost metagenome]